MLALPLRLPTAPYGGHMGHFLLSMLMLSGSAPFGNTCPSFVSTESDYETLPGASLPTKSFDFWEAFWSVRREPLPFRGRPSSLDRAAPCEATPHDLPDKGHPPPCVVTPKSIFEIGRAHV